jgi:hypothetical protein
VSFLKQRKGQQRCWPFVFLALLTMLPLAAQSAAPSAPQHSAAVDHHKKTLHPLRLKLTEI